MSQSTNKQFKVVICDYFGVLISPLIYKLAKVEWDFAVPRGFLISLVRRDDPNKPSSKAMLGKLTIKEVIPLFQKQLAAAAKANHVSSLCNSDVVAALFHSIADLRPNFGLIRALQVLQNAGYKTCFLGNVWINNDLFSDKSARYRVILKSVFDFYFESTQIQLVRPDPEVYHYALKQMGIKAEEAISIEGVEEYAKVAESLGITTILGIDQPTILKKLYELTKVNLKAIPRPIPVTETTIAHGEIVTKAGIKIHFVEKGSGPVIILCHGFPHFWYSWRYQIPYLAFHGYRVIALDQRGYGKSSCPKNVEDYSMDKIVKDIVDVMDALFIPKAVLIGHNIGGVVAWYCALHFPDRVKAVASLNIPYRPQHPTKDFLEIIQHNPKQFDIQFYFQQKGVAEAELEKNLRRSFNFFFGDFNPGGWMASKDIDFSSVTKRGGLLKGLPETLPDNPYLTEEEMQYYIRTFAATGFGPGLDWFRNYQRSWQWNLKFIGRKVAQPALLIVAEHDHFLKQDYAKGMEQHVPRMTRASLPCGHCMQIERPAEVNEIIVSWLEKVNPSRTIQYRHMFNSVNTDVLHRVEDDASTID